MSILLFQCWLHFLHNDIQICFCVNSKYLSSNLSVFVCLCVYSFLVFLFWSRSESLILNWVKKFLGPLIEFYCSGLVNQWSDETWSLVFVVVSLFGKWERCRKVITNHNNYFAKNNTKIKFEWVTHASTQIIGIIIKC